MFFLHMREVVSHERCAVLIEQALRHGFEAARVNHYGKLETLANVRNNERQEYTDVALARELGELIEAAAGQAFPARVNRLSYRYLGDFFRVYRYTPGQFLKPHRDGDLTVGDAVGLVTVLLYLNDVDGGETILMPRGFAHKEDWVTIHPRAGDVLMFEHSCWHEGRPVQSGEKYVLRSDLFYRTSEHPEPE